MSLNTSGVRGSMELWIRVCEQLTHHNKGPDQCIDTLNRLWRKHPRVKTTTGEILLEVPLLTESMLSVTLEHWALEQMLALKTPHNRDQLRSFEPPVVLRWFDQSFLLDGNTRVNHWAKAQNRGPHAVLVISKATQ